MNVQRLALVVGINSYDDKTLAGLRCAADDAMAVEQLLVDLGYGPVVLLCDKAASADARPTRARFDQALTQLCAAAREQEAAGQGTLLLVYVAGHGTQVAGRPCLLLQDARQDDLGGTTVPVDDLQRRLVASTARQVVVLLDACHCGISATRDLMTVTDREFVEAVHALAQGFVLITASTAEQRALEAVEESGHGLFTSFLLQGLRGDAAPPGQGYVTADELYGFVKANVEQWSRDNRVVTQVPTKQAGVAGDIPLSDRLAAPQRWQRPQGPPRDAYPPRRFAAWEDLGPPPGPPEAPAAVYEGERLHLLGRGPEGGLWQRTWEDGAWGEWQACADPGGVVVLGAAPAACSFARGTLDVVATDERGRPLQRRFGAQGWGAWAELGGGPGAGPGPRLVGAPALVGRSNGLEPCMDVFSLGEDGQLWWRGQDLQTSWRDWIALPGLNSAPGAYSWQFDRLAIYVLGPDGHLWQRTCVSWLLGVWGGWYDLGPPGPVVPRQRTGLAPAPAVRSRGANHVDLFLGGGDGRLWQKTWYDGEPAWSEWVAHEDPLQLASGLTVALPPPLEPRRERIDLFAVSAAGSLCHKRWRG